MLQVRAKTVFLASYFANKCSIGRHDLQEEQLPPLPPPSTPLVSFIHFPPPEVRRLLERLNISKATGPDTISSRVLKECSKEFAMPRTKLFALCFHTGVQPGMLKTGNVVPIHKRSSKAAVCSYRPVSLLSVTPKVMETIIKKQLMNHLVGHELLTTKNWDFERGLDQQTS